MNASRLPCVRSPLAAACLVLAALLPACSQPPAPDAGWPAGALLIAEHQALDQLAVRVASLQGTPLADAAAALRHELPDCPRIEAHAPDGDLRALASSLRCHSDHGVLAAVESSRGPSDLLFALPVEGAGRVVGRARFDAADITLDLEWMPGDSPGPLDLLLPGDAPAGPARLGAEAALIHLRVRPARGIDLSKLVPEDSQAQQLFQLRAALFTNAVLEGAWEAAIYLPPDGGEMPRIAVSFDVRSQSVALAAANAFVAELARTWQLEPQPFALGADATGSCLPDVRLLPELAPCYVATEGSLMLGWNAASLGHALGAEPTESGDAPGQIELDLALFAEADALLSRHLAPDERGGSLRWPWRRAIASAQRADDGLLRVHVELRGALGT